LIAFSPLTPDQAKSQRNPLTPAQFGDLAGLPPKLERLANRTNPKTRRAYKGQDKGSCDKT